MKVVVEFGVDADIIECPDHVIDRLEEFRERFLEWLFDTRNDHSYWWYENGKKYGCCYRSEAFVEWLNAFVLNDSLTKATVIESNVTKWNKKLPSVFF